MMVQEACLVCSCGSGTAPVSIYSALPSSRGTILTSLRDIVGQQQMDQACRASQVLCAKCLHLLLNIIYLECQIVVLREEFPTTFHKGVEARRAGCVEPSPEGSGGGFEEGDSSNSPRHRDDAFKKIDEKSDLLLFVDKLMPIKKFPEKCELVQEKDFTKKFGPLMENRLPVKFEVISSGDLSADPYNSSEVLAVPHLSFTSSQDLNSLLPKHCLDDINNLQPHTDKYTDKHTDIYNNCSFKYSDGLPTKLKSHTSTELQRTGDENDSSLTKLTSFASIELQRNVVGSDRKNVGKVEGVGEDGEREDRGERGEIERVGGWDEGEGGENGKVGEQGEAEGGEAREGGDRGEAEGGESICVIPDMDDLSSAEEVPVLHFSPEIYENIPNSRTTKATKPGGARRKRKTGCTKMKRKIEDSGGEQEETMKSERGGGAKECALCGEVFSDAKQLGRHQGQAHPSHYPYSCRTCPHAHYREKAKLTQHLRLAHHLTAHTCPGCSHEAGSQNSLDQHIIQHHPSSRFFQCHICHKAFRTHRYLHFVHIKRCHLGLPIKYSCDKCSRGFVDKSSFENHKVTHSVTRDYTCEFCGASFRTSYALKVHVNTHTQEKKYTCGDCGATFLRVCNLSAHRRRFHSCSDVHLVCEMCGVASATQRDLRRHQQASHTREKPFACHICTRTYTTRDSLNTHLRTHSGDRPHKCVCGKAFLKRDTLKRHQRFVHEGEQLPSHSTAAQGPHNTSSLQTDLPFHAPSCFQTSTPLQTTPPLQTTSPLQTAQITVSAEAVQATDTTVELEQEDLSGGHTVVITLRECDARQSDPLTVYSVDTLDALSATHLLLTSLPATTITTSCTLSDSACTTASTSLTVSHSNFTTTAASALSHPTVTTANTPTLSHSAFTIASTPTLSQSNFSAQTTVTNLSGATPSPTPHLVQLQDVHTSPATVSFVTPWPHTL